MGLGASAGGLDAYKAFFSKMPADSGMSFVLVQHLDPHYESSLVAIVAGYTTMPVHLAEDGVEISPNQVYVIPPDAILTIEDGALHLTRPAPSAARRTSINTFLTSLAEDQRENAVGIILSGFGSDGALGIAAIKEQGGLTLSQAEFDHHAKSGMPQSAASGGFVDHVLAVEDMPAALMDYRHHRIIGDATKGPDGIRQDLPNYLVTICAVLHSRLGRDFSQYKTGTLMRRIQRRMHVLQTDEVPAYIEQLRALPHEAELLFRELLISVTRFFRNPEAFEALETKVIPELLADLRSTDPIRVWVAGCATGEEAYSIAILLKEGLDRTGCHRPIQIFATDIDDRAIEAARAGLYLGAIASDLSAERLERNFVKEDGNYRVAKGLREMCLFSTHDLVKDPPFSRLDLISCRNLLIYFEPQLQHRVLTTFHYALRSGRHLFLGPSEGTTAQVHLFAPLDKQHRLYIRRDTTARLPAFPLSRSSERLPLAKQAAPSARDEIDQRVARAIARYAPAFLVVDRQHDILRFSGHTAKYLEPAPGAASLNLFNLLHTDLRAAARAALKEAAATGERVLHGTVSIEVGEQYEAVNLIVEPLGDPGEGGPVRYRVPRGRKRETSSKGHGSAGPAQRGW
ncbi:CheR family methyltransferase [Siccirubricoccus sp. G192]|uniref:CheR family methyltransferase n=1 Tax=Siccirubricoccus sp. G192 TaxID=2849651 RepID=UPI0028117468|nr:CheR family methyltransferase [Siccirubricoccus sp. G192]